MARSTFILPALLTLLVTTSACSAPAPSIEEDGVYTIRVADSYPIGHPFSKAGATHFMDEIERESDGRVTFEYFPAEQMGAAADLPSLVASGVVDMASIAPAYSPSELPLSGVADLPGLVSDSCTGSAAVQSLTDEGGVLFREDFAPKGLRPLVVGLIPDYEVMTGSRQVSTPKDVSGLRLRSSGGTIDRTVEGLGAAPVGMPATEMYEAISRGTVGGTVLGAVSATPYRLEEVTKYTTRGARLGSFTMTYSLSEATWDELPADLQKVFREVGRDTTANLCKALQDGNTKGEKALDDAGVKVHEIKPRERAAWDEAVMPVRQQWSQDMAKIGRPGDEALKDLETALKEEGNDAEGQ